MKTLKSVSPVPATWGMPNWPADLWPFTASKARSNLLRDQDTRDELVRCGAHTRPAQHLVFIGANYLAWLQRKSSRVNDFEIAPNAKQAGRAA